MILQEAEWRAAHLEAARRTNPLKMKVGAFFVKLKAQPEPRERASAGAVLGVSLHVCSVSRTVAVVSSSLCFVGNFSVGEERKPEQERLPRCGAQCLVVCGKGGDKVEWRWVV